MPEWWVILLVFLLLFGAKKLPELARGLGLGIKEFKKASKEVSNEIDKDDEQKIERERQNKINNNT